MRKRKSKSGERRYRSTFGSGPVGKLCQDAREQILVRTVSDYLLATFSLDYDDPDGVFTGWKIVFDQTSPWISEEAVKGSDDSPSQIRAFAAHVVCQSLCGLFHWHKMVLKEEIDTHPHLITHSPVSTNTPPTIRTRNIPTNFDVNTFLDVLCHALTQCVRKMFRDGSTLDIIVKWKEGERRPDIIIYVQQGVKTRQSLEKVFTEIDTIRDAATQTS